MHRLASSLIALAFAVAVVSAGASCSGGTNGNPDGGPVNTGCQTGQAKFNGVCVVTPTMEAQRTACLDVNEFCDPTGMKTPNLACLTGTPATHPMMPDKVTLTGFVHPFSGGNSNAVVTIQIYREADLSSGGDITTVTPIVTKAVTFVPSMATDPTQFRACDTDPKVGCVAVTPDACMPPATTVCNDGLDGRPDDKNYCHMVNGGPVCTARLRWEPRFSIDGIPTNTPLVIRTSGDNGMPSTNWNTLVQWNVFLASDAKSCSGDDQAVECLDTSDMTDPKYQLNVNVISQADYTSIPEASGLAQGISAGQGAVAGEVHDCDNVRVSYLEVGVAPAGDRFTYFNGNPYQTVPDGSRTSTDQLGLYASLNDSPGKTVVQAVGLVNGKTVSFGTYTAYVYAGSISVVNVNGGHPVQVTSP